MPRNVNELLIDVYWERCGFLEDLDKDPPVEMLQKAHRLYFLRGYHPTTGAGTLLYIGTTLRGPGRLKEHWQQWASLEPDSIEVHGGSLAKFEDWEKWRQDKGPRYDRFEDDKLVQCVEKLLIFAHQPPYNSRDLNECPQLEDTHVRAFNTGRCAPLLPEVSTRRYRDIKLPPQHPSS